MQTLERRVLLTTSTPDVNSEQAREISAVLGGQYFQRIYYPQDGVLASTALSIVRSKGVPHEPLVGLSALCANELQEDLDKRIADTVLRLGQDPFSSLVIAEPSVVRNILDKTNAPKNILPRFGELYILGPSYAQNREKKLQYRASMDKRIFTGSKI